MDKIDKKINGMVQPPNEYNIDPIKGPNINPIDEAVSANAIWDSTSLGNNLGIQEQKPQIKAAFAIPLVILAIIAVMTIKQYSRIKYCKQNKTRHTDYTMTDQMIIFILFFSVNIDPRYSDPKNPPRGCMENITPINVNSNPFQFAKIGKNGAIIEIEQPIKKLQKLKEWNSS